MTLPREDEVLTLQAENTQLRAQIAELLAVTTQLRQQIESQQSRIAQLVKSTFGSKSERVLGPTLFDDLLDQLPDEPPTPPEPPTGPPAGTSPTRPRRPGGHGRRIIPEHLPRERFEIDFSEAEIICPCCSIKRIRVGQQLSERIDYRPAVLFIREIARPTYVCRHCERSGHDPQFATPPLPPEPIPRGGVGSGLLAHLVVAKFIDHLPLYRQELILKRQGWSIPRSTLCDHLHACGLLLDPLYRLMIHRLKQSAMLHADDSPVSLMRPRRSAYAWVYLGDAANPYTLFDLTVGRRREFPETVLAGFQGFVQADAYAGYRGVHGDTRHVGCWMHARRKFVEARDSNIARASEALAFIRTLYEVERELTALGLSGDQAATHRRTRAGPVLVRFAAWLETEQRRERPKSPLGQAILYSRNQWPSLNRYLHDSRLAIDNGAAERAIRPLAVGRKNWLFIGGDRGLSTAAVLMSVCASATRHGVNQWEYLRDLFDRLPALPTNSDLTSLLPDNWAKAHPDH